jgi:type IV pilus assembly protein PilA
VRDQNGFSLIELLIVVAIILVITAIAIPRLLQARSSAQESAAVGTLKAINSAEITYSTAYPSCGFVDMPSLGGDGSGPGTSGILDNVFPDRGGYHFAINLTGPGGDCGMTSGAEYSVEGSPLNPQYLRYFYTDQSAVVRFRFGGPATLTDASIE